MSASEKCSTGQRRRMSSFKDMMFRAIDQISFATGEITPKHKDHTLTIV